MSSNPLVRPGRVDSPAPALRLVATFPNSAQGNLAIQLAGTLGIRQDRLGVTAPDRLERGQGMVLSIPCADESEAGRIESVFQNLGGTVHRSPA
jgi:hypothetical protein